MSKSYFLEAKEHEDLRLQIINEIFSGTSQSLLNSCNLKPGMQILEIGCGNGTMAIWLAKQVEPNGHVIAIDISEKQIQAATHQAEKDDITNIEFKVLSAYDIQQLKITFDLIYHRFLFTHLANPKTVLKSIHTVLKPGGTVACESSILSHCFSDPATKSYDDFIKIGKYLFTEQGKDYDSGTNLYSSIMKEGFEDVTVNLIHPLLRTKREKHMMILGLKNAASFFVQEGIAKEDEINELITQMIEDAKDETTIWAPSSVCQVSGVKNQHE